MKTLLKRPLLMLLLFIGVFALMLGVLWIWTSNVPNTLDAYGFVFLLFGFFGFYFFWLYLLGYRFNLLDNGAHENKRFKIFKIVLLVSFITYLAGISIEIHYLFNEYRNIPEILNTLIGIILTYCFIHIIIVLTRNNKYYDKGDDPKFFDYIITAFLVSFIPVGLLIMHAHLKALLKERQILD